MSILALLATALLWAILGKVDVIATASGRFVPIGRTKAIQPFETGVVQTIKIRDGEHVSEGQVLVELDATENMAERDKHAHAFVEAALEKARLDALIIDDLTAFSSPQDAPVSLVLAAKSRMEAQKGEQDEKLARFDRDLAQKRAELEQAKATIARIDATLPMLRERKAIRESGYKNEFFNKLDYLESSRMLADQEHERIVQTHKQDEVAAAIEGLEHQKAQAAAEYRKGLYADLAKARLDALDHEQGLIKAGQRTRLQTLKAPVAGTVQQLAVHTIGGVVTPAQRLMMVVPEEAGLEIEANLPNKDVGFVHQGQEVEVKVETFDFTRYGLLHGAVKSVSRDSVLPEDEAKTQKPLDPKDASDEKERQSREPAYVAHIAVKEAGLQTEHGFKPAEPGMAVVAEIKTGRRRVIDYLLSPLIRYRHDGLRER